MRIVAVGMLALILAGCNQTVSQGSPGAISADASMQELPPIYEPLVDMHRIKESKYKLDLAGCRMQAAPQERVARAAAQQAEAGAMIMLAGDVLGAIPGANRKEANLIHKAGGALQGAGGSAAAGGATTADAALNDYALVVNTCLRHRGYALLR